jgi:hypothetical protein
LELDALDTQDASTQAVVNAAQEWSAQRVSILTYERTNHSIMSIPRKSKVNEARVVDFSGIQREEEVNRVSKLSKSSACFAAPIIAMQQTGS